MIFHIYLLEDGAHAKNSRRREDTFLPDSVSRHYPPSPPFVSSDVETLRVRPRRDYKIALPPPREIFNLVYYRPATLPSPPPQTLSPLFRPTKIA